MAKRTKVTVKKTGGPTPSQMKWQDLVKKAIGGNQLNDAEMRGYLNSKMQAIMHWGGQILGQITKVRQKAQAALLVENSEGIKKGFQGETSKYQPMSAQKALDAADAVDDPSTVGSFTNLADFKRKILKTEGWQMGHATLSVSTLMTAAYLSANLREPLGGNINSQGNKEFRQELKALYMAQKKVDALTVKDWENAKAGGGTGIEQGVMLVLNQLSKLKHGFDITTLLKMDVDIAKGKAGSTTELAMELEAYNNWKSKVGDPFTKLTKELWTTQVAIGIKKKLKGAQIPHFIGSKSLMRNIKDGFIDQAVKGKAPKVKYTKKVGKTKVGKDIKDVAKHRTKLQNLQKKIKAEMKAFSALPLPQEKPSSGGAGSHKQLASLVQLLNAKLPQTVSENMGEPGLVYRSGRFANSVRVTDVIPTAQGYPSIGYTYQKSPYQVFEMGAGTPPWATPARDPRKMINASIREIARELAVGRFYTRRV